MKKSKGLINDCIKHMCHKAHDADSRFGLLLILLNYNKYRKFYKFLKKSQWWSKEEIEKYQLEKLHDLLNHSYKNVPYYKKIFDENGFKPEDIRSFQDLQKLPFLTKKMVRENINDLKSKDCPEEKFLRVTTGGTTGTPLYLYVEKVTSALQMSVYNKICLERIGYNYTDKVISMREEVFSSKDDTKFWKYLYFGRHLVLSSFHINEKTLPEYVKKIRKFKPKYFISFPSSIINLAKYMKKNNIEPFPSLKALICGAEALYDWQRELLEEVFQCRIFEIYGHAEDSTMACSCEISNYYHFFPQMGVLELVDKNGKAVTKEGEKGEVIVTGFKNFLFPFIRYKTGDIGVYTNEKCSCGRNYPLLKRIEGRWEQEFIITKDDLLISTALVHLHSEVFDNVKQFQFYQEKKGEVVYRIVKSDEYTDEDTKNIKKELTKKLGRNVDIKIEFMDSIPPTKQGKYKYLVQKIPIELKDR